MSPDTSSVGYSKQESVPLPTGGLPGKLATLNGGKNVTPNICIEGGRVEFVKSPIDRGDEKQDYLKVSETERVMFYFNNCFLTNIEYKTIIENTIVCDVNINIRGLYLERATLK